LVGYSGMALEADGRRGFVVGLGHRQPLNWPLELRYGRAEAKPLGSGPPRPSTGPVGRGSGRGGATGGGRASSVDGTITTPWRVVLLGRDLNALANSDVLPSLCPPADARLFPHGLGTARG